MTDKHAKRPRDNTPPRAGNVLRRCERYAAFVLSTQSCWQLILNRAMLLPYARGLQPRASVAPQASHGPAVVVPR